MNIENLRAILNKDLTPEEKTIRLQQQLDFVDRIYPDISRRLAELEGYVKALMDSRQPLNMIDTPYLSPPNLPLPQFNPNNGEMIGQKQNEAERITTDKIYSFLNPEVNDG